MLEDTRAGYRVWCGLRLEEHDLVYLFTDAGSIANRSAIPLGTRSDPFGGDARDPGDTPQRRPIGTSSPAK